MAGGPNTKRSHSICNHHILLSPRVDNLSTSVALVTGTAGVPACFLGLITLRDDIALEIRQARTPAAPAPGANVKSSALLRAVKRHGFDRYRTLPYYPTALRKGCI